MNKTLTHNFFRHLKKPFLLAAFAVTFVFISGGYSSLHAENDFGILAKTIRCYPNPAVSFVNFEFLPYAISKNYSLQVFSFTGKKMYETNVSSLKTTLTFTNEFYRGIYVYQLRDNSGKIIETGKFQVIK